MATTHVAPGITLSSYLRPSGYSPGHAHAAYQIGLLEGGQGHAFYRGAQQTLADELIVFDSGEAHAGKLVGPTGWLRRTFLDVEPCALQRIAHVVTDQPVPTFHFPKLVAPDLLPRFAALFVDARRSMSGLEAEEKTVDALSCLLMRHADVRLRPRPAKQEPRAVRDARAYLEAHLTENISLATLGHVTQTNWDVLRRTFRRQVGVPPHRYQVLLRMERAKTLILSDMPIAQAAAAVGFADQAHLTRAFRQHLGVTPKALSSGRQNVQDAPV